MQIRALCENVESQGYMFDEDINIITIQEYQNTIKEEIGYISEFRHHYLKGKEGYLIKLLDYDFELVDGVL